jgi:hypothetical protein
MGYASPPNAGHTSYPRESGYTAYQPHTGYAPNANYGSTVRYGRPLQTNLAASRESSKRMRGKAIVGLRAWAVLQTFDLAVGAASIHRDWESFQKTLSQIRANSSTPPVTPTTFSGLPLVVDSAGFLVVLAGLAFLIWQHSTAEVARELGYPAKRSPALGVGSWFIPVVNFWFPYQSLRDLLPPGHPARSRALTAWLLYIAGLLLTLVGYVIAIIGSVLAVAPVLVAAACYITVAVIGGQLIQTVDQEHEKAMTQPMSLGVQGGAW